MAISGVEAAAATKGVSASNTGPRRSSTKQAAPPTYVKGNT